MDARKASVCGAAGKRRLKQRAALYSSTLCCPRGSHYQHSQMLLIDTGFFYCRERSQGQGSIMSMESFRRAASLQNAYLWQQHKRQCIISKLTLSHRLTISPKAKDLAFACRPRHIGFDMVHSPTLIFTAKAFYIPREDARTERMSLRATHTLTPKMNVCTQIPPVL